MTMPIAGNGACANGTNVSATGGALTASDRVLPTTATISPRDGRWIPTQLQAFADRIAVGPELLRHRRR